MQQFLQGNYYAVKFCLDLWDISQVWDDLVDKDSDVPAEKISDAFTKAIFELTGNPFYVEHIMTFRPLIMDTILQWEDANSLEHSTDQAKHMAYMLRAGIYNIFCYCAFLIVGHDAYRAMQGKMRLMYGETLQSFMEEMKNA